MSGENVRKERVSCNVPVCVRMHGQSPGGQRALGGTPGHSFVNLV